MSTRLSKTINIICHWILILIAFKKNKKWKKKKTNQTVKETQVNQTLSWKDIVNNIKLPYNTYVFVSIRNSGKSKSIRNLIVELLQKIHQYVTCSTAKPLFL